MQTRQIAGGSVAIGTQLAYLGRPFTVARLDPMPAHAALGPRWIARDDQGRGIIVYEQHPVTIVAVEVSA